MLLFSMLLTLTMPSISLADNTLPPVDSKEARAMRLNQRLEEIREMDTKNMTRKEKRELRVEVRTIKKELAAISGGVYLSIGAILLIALLLILLL
ncbi:MAG TPA: hypothetical protein VEB86_00040 [Chryseosolibacter sp.]|nr:hypothetical protein [Chryseosolibacter sp.]